MPSDKAETVPVDHSGSGLIYGIHAVSEALRREDGQLREIWVRRDKSGRKLQTIIDLARRHRIRLRFVGRTGMPRVSGPHQGVVARRSAVKLLKLQQLLERAVRRSRSPRLLALDSVQDPRNLGAVLRSALAAGMDGVILTRERSAPLSGTVMKTAAGAVSHLDICQVVNLAETLKLVKKEGYWVYGTVVDPEAVPLYEADLALPLCLVIGGEGKGIRPLVQKQCDLLLTIPMRGELDSLNCSVAAAVIMFEIARRYRSAAGHDKG